MTELFQVIKTLKPSQRLYGFLFLVLITSATAIITSYLKTDDCGEFANNYNDCVTNYTKSQEFVNNCMNESNQKTNDLIVLAGIIDSIRLCKTIQYTTITTENHPIKLDRYENVVSSVQMSDSSGVVHEVNPVVRENLTPIDRTKIKKIETIVPIPATQKKYIDSASSILNKYKKD